MTILSADEVWSSETWSDEFTGAREYTRVFRVISDDPSESPLAVRNSLLLPQPLTGFPGDSAAVAKNRSSERSDESRLVWTVTISYEFDPENPDESEEYEEDPTARPAKIRWTSSLENQPVFKDKDDEAIVNSAGDYFDPPPEFPVAVWQANVQKNVSSIPAAILDWAGAINNAPYDLDGISVEEKKSRLVSIDIGEVQEENGVSFRQLTMGIAFYRDEVVLSILDQGFRIKEVDGETVTIKDILIEDEDGKMQRPSAPVLLNGEGGKLADPSPENAVFIDFEPKVAYIDFSILPLT